MSQFVNHSKTRFVSMKKYNKSFLWRSRWSNVSHTLLMLTPLNVFCLSKLKRLVYTLQFICCYCLRYKQKNYHVVWQTDRNLKIIDWWIQAGNKYIEMWLASLAVQPAVYRCTTPPPKKNTKTRPWHLTPEKNIKERETHSICGSLSFSRLSFNVTFH